MRKTSFALIFSLLALLAVPALAAGPAPAPITNSVTAPEATAPAPAITLQLLADPLAAVVPAASSSCPYGGPYCNEDQDCDAWCGAPGFGQCEIHHWTGCCICLG